MPERPAAPHTVYSGQRLDVIGDTVFAVGAVLLVAFVAALASGHSYREEKGSPAPVTPEPTPIRRKPVEV